MNWVCVMALFCALPVSNCRAAFSTAVSSLILGEEEKPDLENGDQDREEWQCDEAKLDRGDATLVAGE